MIRLLTLVSVLMLLTALTGCTNKELCVLHPHQRNLLIQFDWRDAPDANPESMIVYFYPLEGQSLPMRFFEFDNLAGDSVAIMEGKYRVLCYNNDIEASQARNVHDFTLHEAFTREGSILENVYGGTARHMPRAKGTENERVVINPDMMWGCATVDVEITQDGISYLPVPPSRGDLTRTSDIPAQRTLVLYPHQTVCVYTYEITGVENLKYARQMCASLSSMAPSMRLADESLSTEPVTIPAPASADGPSTIRGAFYTFGHHPDLDNPHMLALYVWRADGQGVYYTEDVTDQIHSAPDKRRVHIRLSGLKLEKPMTNGDGFHPDVDPWADEFRDLIM